MLYAKCMWKRRKIRTPRLRKKRRQERIDRLQRQLAFVGALVLLFSQLSMLPMFRIDRVVVSGNEVTTIHEIQDVVYEKLTGYYLSLFSRRNVFLFPRRAIRDELLQNIPRIEQVDVDIENLNTISITIDERERYAVYCLPASPSSAQEGSGDQTTDCYYFDEAGFVFDKAPSIVSDDLFVYSGDVLGTSTKPIGHYVLGDSEAIAYTEAFAAATIKLLPGKVVGLFVVSEGEHRFILDSGAEIIVDPREGQVAYEDALRNINAIVSDEEFLEQAGDTLSNLEYLDVRYGRKAFFKLAPSN